MEISTETLIRVILSVAAALVMSFVATPLVKLFAQRVNALDVPKDDRRMHTQPVPLLGGLAIFIGFIFSALIFSDLSRPIQSILVGAVIMVITGAIDDVIDIKPWMKALAQLIAALVVVLWGGIDIDYFTNPLAVFGIGDEFIYLGVLAVPCTILWIIAVTNSINLIDGLDGLAVGVSAIASATMLITALFINNSGSAIMMGALFGACIGFIPYNRNPAKIFMGDTGALLLGFVLSSMSVLGLFKFYAAISSFVPFIILALPIFDEVFATFRRLAKGQMPWHGDRGHVHHRLINMGLSQKHAVAVCYCASTVLGLLAVVLTTDGGVKAFVLGIVFVAAAIVAVKLFKQPPTFDLQNSEKENDEGHN